MAAEEILTLFDLYWFENELFAGIPLFHPKEAPENHFRIPPTRALQVRSQSEYTLGSNFSPPEKTPPMNSIPGNSKLQTIFSGKEVIEFPEKVAGKGKPPMKNRRKRKGSSLSKSLSDLEFEELKGFMDLGFIFSEEDKNSSLVSIIPGLQRLGRKEGEKKEEVKEEKGDEIEICRPYLSEAWGVIDEEMEKGILMNWRVSSMGTNEMDMKDNLRFWAHTVASTVR